MHEKIYKNIDIILSIFLILVALVIFLFSIASNRINPFVASSKIIAVLVAPAIVLYLRKDKIKRSSIIVTTIIDSNNKIIFLLFIFMFTCFAFCFYILYSHLYYYPIEYTYIKIIAGLCIFASICLTNINKKNYYVLLLVIIIFSLFNRLSIYDLYPVAFGGDVWAHLDLVDKISQFGFLNHVSYMTYSNYPIMHILIVSFKLMANATLTQSSMYAITVSNSLSVVFIALISLELLEDKKISLYSAFLLSILGSHITHSFSLVGLSYPLIIGPLLILLILKYYKNRKANLVILCFILMLAITLAHPNSSFMLITMICIFSIVSILVKKVYGQNNSDASLIQLWFIFFAVNIAYWIYISHFMAHIPDIVENIVFLKRGEATPYMMHASREVTPTIMLENVVDSISLLLLIFGLLSIFNKNNRIAISYFIATALLSFLGIFTLLINLYSTLPWRWVYLGGLFGVIINSFGFSELTKGNNHRILKISGILLILTFIILNLGGYSKDSLFYGNRLLTNDYSEERTGLSYPELHASYFLIKYYDKSSIYSDFEFLDLISRKYFNSSLRTDFLLDKEYDKIKGILVLRNYILINPMKLRTSSSGYDLIDYRLNQGFKTALKSNLGADKIYNSDEIECYSVG